ncbi:hypothetical protein IL306_005398 [Fusarium sp. DS 682]|nr:hypothetical protein IL306_005398 [Fusarium sp. DS 682]
MSLRRLSARRCPYSSILQLTIGVCTPPMEGEPSHWVLMLAERDAEYATWYHARGGPRLGKRWEVVVESGRLNSWAVDNRYCVAEISARHARKVNAAARKIPGRFCQEWVFDVLRDLEAQDVVPPGTVKKIARVMEEDPYADASPIVEVKEYEGFHDKMSDWVEKHCLSRLGSPRR